MLPTEDDERPRTIDLNSTTTRNRRAYWLSKFKTDFNTMRALGVREPKIVMLLHEPSDLSAQGLDAYMFEACVSTKAEMPEAVITERVKPVSEGGWGIDADYMRRRIEQELETARDYTQVQITEIAPGF